MLYGLSSTILLPELEISLENQHKFCPNSESTWYKFWADKLTKKTTYNKKQRLPSVFSKALKPIFERLSNNQLLEGAGLVLLKMLVKVSTAVWMRWQQMQSQMQSERFT